MQDSHAHSGGDVRAAAVQEKPRQALFLDEERTGAKNITDRIWPVVMARALKMRTQVSIPVSNGVLMWINREARTEKGPSVVRPSAAERLKGSPARSSAYVTARAISASTTPVRFYRRPRCKDPLRSSG